MRNLLLVVFGLLFLIAKSQREKDTEYIQRKNFVYFSPVDLFLKTFELGYERNLKNRDAIAVFGGFKLDKGNEGINRSGGTGEIQYRVNLLYPEESEMIILKPFSVFAYFAPFLSYRYEEINEPGNSDIPVTSYINSGFGGIGFGFRLRGLRNRFSLNVYGGGGLKYSDINGNKKYNSFWDVGYTGFAPKLSLQMGIAF